MRVYSPSGKNYVHIIEVPRTEIDKIDVAVCAQPSETLNAFYKRQTRKPDILTNGSFFGLSGSLPCFGIMDEGAVLTNDGLRIWGIGVRGNADIAYGKIGTTWRDWISGYPVLIENGKKSTITDAQEINYKARRTIWGFNKDYVYLVTVDSPGFNFSEMQTLMYELGCEAAINLDGGGSTRALVKGETITNGIENRPVDNVLAIYLKAETSKEPSANTYNKGGETLKIYEDIIPTFGKVRPGTKRTKKWIVIHETGNPNKGANAKGHSAYMKNLAAANTTYTSWHYTVDDTCAYHHIPDDEVAWHASDSTKEGGGNMAGIGIEICVNSDGNFAKARDNAAWLVAKLLKENNLTISAVKQHYDFAPDKKNCPQTIRDKGLWNDFLSAIQKYYGGATSSNNTTAPTPTTTLKFKVGDVVNFTGSKCYASTNGAGGVAVRKQGLAKITSIYEKGKHPYHCRSINGAGTFVAGVYGWVDAKDVQAIETFKPYLIQVTADVLNVRSGPSTSYRVTTTIKKNGVYTIVKEKNGWGLLKSGAGWVSLGYTKKLRDA